MKNITFFERFEADILSGLKTITIRDESEKDYEAGDVVNVSTYEDNRWFCKVIVEQVVPITLEQLTVYHAKQENMSLEQLKAVIKDIYPNTDDFYVISYSLL